MYLTHATITRLSPRPISRTRWPRRSCAAPCAVAGKTPLRLAAPDLSRAQGRPRRSPVASTGDESLRHQEAGTWIAGFAPAMTSPPAQQRTGHIPLLVAVTLGPLVKLRESWADHRVSHGEILSRGWLPALPDSRLACAGGPGGRQRPHRIGWVESREGGLRRMRH